MLDIPVYESRHTHRRSRWPERTLFTPRPVFGDFNRPLKTNNGRSPSRVRRPPDFLSPVLELPKHRALIFGSSMPSLYPTSISFSLGHTINNCRNYETIKRLSFHLAMFVYAGLAIFLRVNYVCRFLLRRFIPDHKSSLALTIARVDLGRICGPV